MDKKYEKLSSQPLFRHPDLVVATCQFGHGVFATENIPADTTLEECYHLRIRKEDCSGIIDDYVYGLEPDHGSSEEDFQKKQESIHIGFTFKF